MNRIEMNRQFAENLERERTILSLTQQQMATELGMSLSAYKRLITCATDKVDLYALHRLYLLTGKLAYEYTSISDPYLNLKQKIAKLSPASLTYIDSLIDFEKTFASTHTDCDEYLTVYIPTGNMEDGMIYDSANIEKVKIGSARNKYSSLISCGIKITSNHLHPVYNKDDILLISPRPIRDGDTGIFVRKDNGCVYIRKFYQTSPCKLEPVNSYGETFYVDSTDKTSMDNWYKFGCVITKIR